MTTTARRPIRWSVVAAPWIAMLLSAAVAWGAELVPDAPNSHERFLEHLSTSRSRTREELVHIYDAFLSRARDNHVVAMERCTFVRQSSPEEELEEGDGADEAFGAWKCVEDLAKQFPREPAVILYRLENDWTEGAIAYGLAKLDDTSVAWSNEQRASALGLLAERRYTARDLKGASDLADDAWRHDPNYDRTLIVADYLRSIGQSGAAVKLLSERIGDDEKPLRLVQKARLLLDLDDPLSAKKALERASKLGDAYVDPILQGRVLEEAGDTEGARAFYASRADAWNKQQVLTRLFVVDMERGSLKAASASYRALREIGWEVDPLGRHRMALTLRYPTAPWRFEDMLGILGFFAFFIAVAVVPGVIYLPVHYVGLLRRVRDKPIVETRFRLRHAFAASSLMLASGIFAEYVFAYDEIALIFDDSVKPRHDAIGLARVGVLALSGTALSAAAFARKTDWLALKPSEWLRARTIGSAFRFLLLLMVVAFINGIFIKLFGGEATDGPSIALSTRAILTAMRTVYGMPVMLLFAVAIVPLAEEFLFRYVLLDGLHRHIPFGWANGLQATLFGLMHDDLARLPLLIAMGVFTGILRRRTGGIAAGTVLHAINNFLAILVFSYLR